MEVLEAKIDSLTGLVEGFAKELGGISSRMSSGFEQMEVGFTEVRTDIEDLARMTANELSLVREEMTLMATKVDLDELRGDVDIMLDKHIGIFRKDYDGLAKRVKTLETHVLK